ncbi:MAG TPA: PKD domain-containing protein [Flavobacteriales bacterium]|nr:PKD domain-containing protein [Flavobacteriales bacterium]
MISRYVLVFGLLFPACFQAQTLQEFFFNSNLNPTGNGNPLTELISCTAAAGSYSQADITTSEGLCTNATAFCFGDGGGLSYPNSSITSQYSINLFFKFDALTGYSRVIDFSNSTADAGIYLLNNCLNFYPNGNIGTCPFFQPNLYYLFTFVRNGVNNQISIYVNGTLFGSYTDSGNIYRPATTSTPINFFRDDNAVSCENASGCIKYASVSSNVLSATQVDSIWQEICDIAFIECEADISYDQSPYSVSLTSPQPVTLDGNSNGIFSSTSGLSINPQTGAINPSLSTPGTYEVTYTLDASCNNFSTTATVVIQANNSNCNPSGNMLLFANYDGGTLNINIDQNIPNLKIGVLTYEPVTVNILGPYAGNVTQVIRAGFSDTNHDHCGLGVFTTSINGPIPANYSNINYPSVTLSNANGNPNIICAYSCDNGSYQGGCNTIDQVIDYFSTALSGNMYSLIVQYCCFNGSTTYSYSGLANQCCTSITGTATIAYTGSPYCSGIAQTPAPLITGSTGGSFSAPGGLDIDPVTGIISPQTSSIGSYTVTYTLPGCPGFSTTTEVEIGSSTPAPTGVSPQSVCQQATLGDLVVNGTAIQWYFDAAGTQQATPNSGVTDNTHYYASQTVDGCESSELLDILVQFQASSPLGISPTGTVTICNGGTVVLTAEAGYSQYLWSNSGTGQIQTIGNSGTYSVSTYDANGCMLESEQVTVNVQAPFSISVSPAQPETACIGETVVLTAQSGYQNYTWSNSQLGQVLNVTSSGLYSVSAENANGCTGTSGAISVIFEQQPTAAFTYIEGNELYEIDFTCNSSASSYLWDFGDGYVNGTASISHIFPFDNTWPVSLIVSNACGIDTVFQDVVVIKSGIADLGSLKQVILSPNPGSDQVVLSGFSQANQDIQLAIYSVDGKRVMQTQTSVKGEFQVEIKTTDLPAGSYWIQLVNIDGKMTLPWIKL